VFGFSPLPASTLRHWSSPAREKRWWTCTPTCFGDAGARAFARRRGRR
jgi:hypothetical protein